MYHGQKKAEFLRLLILSSAKDLHRLLLHVEDRVTASSILSQSDRAVKMCNENSSKNYPACRTIVEL
ncbi:hypothetical protein WN48_00257 [Eufriesea mexicana]|nr:hypothetical protein WN48_00257 [Eufriesea mexicana]